RIDVSSKALVSNKNHKEQLYYTQLFKLTADSHFDILLSPV
ncbi:hypothetical protein X975_13558, partial [Stegodyphus mimosarum]